MKKLKLITIDGPSASGKSSVSRMVASELGWKWISTGAFYRGLALAALDQGIPLDHESDLIKLAKAKFWEIKMTPQESLVLVHQVDRSQEISGEKVGAVASQISQIPQVRKALLERQRACFHEELGLVAEGRDCGTVVFPQAPAKIYLTASPATRAMRRSEEEASDHEDTLEMQKIRDDQDSQRKVAPLRMADGALHIDSSYLSLEEVVAEVLNYYKLQGKQD